MSRLYVANTTKQRHLFAYRVPADEWSTTARGLKLASTMIESGEQMQIMGDVPLPVIKAIIAQHEPYGLISVEEVPVTRAYVGLCYSLDKPVDMERLKYAVDHNQGVLFDQGAQLRLEMAIAQASTMETTLRRPMTTVDVEVLEDSDRPTMGERLRVVNTGG